MKWPAGVPFPHPGGGAWDSMMLGNDSSNYISRVCRMLEAETKTLMLAEKLQNQKSTDDHTADNRADLLTKSEHTVSFKQLLDKLKGFDGVAK